MLSRKQQRKTIIIGYIIMSPVALAIILTLVSTKKAVFTASAAEVEETTAESAEKAEKADFDEDSAMPCVDREAFLEWYAEYIATNEADAGAQIGAEDNQEETDEQETGEEGRPDADPADQQEPLPEAEPETAAAVESAVPLYAIDGQLVTDAGIQERLYRSLEAAGIEYWYTGALAQMMQESSGNVYAENPNGLDKGLYQFREPFWREPEDIFSVDAQIRRYVNETAARLNAGLSADEVISRHNTSDYCPEINQEYVAAVRSWLGKMEAVR